MAAANLKKPVLLSESTTSSIGAMETMWAEMRRARERAGFGASARPPNSVTAVEYAERMNLKTTTARRELDMLVQSGHMQESLAYAPSTAGRLVKTKVYSLVK